jgi:hypothetical protein
MDNNLVKEFKEGIFNLRTRRFGTVAELMIKKLTNLGGSKNLAYDLHDEELNNRIEVKFSTVMKANDATISIKNVIEQCIKATLSNRMMKSDEVSKESFDCNIQQIKRVEFEVLFYGLFFYDKIAIFSMTSDQILSCPGYSDFQHRGNEGEGQFHINNSSYGFHLNNHLVQWLSYEELYDLFKDRSIS